jgi:organic hydroperoxide reductase OsmC/OhrA
MTAPFPHHYRAALRWTAEGTDLTAGSRPVLQGDAPPEFGGDERRWSPEHLLLASLSLCLLTTFQSVVRKAKLEVLGYAADVEGVLDKTPAGLGFVSLTLIVHVEVAAGEVDRARRLLETAHKHCIVANALRPPVHLDASVVARESAPMAGAR